MTESIQKKKLKKNHQRISQGVNDEYVTELLEKLVGPFVTTAEIIHGIRLGFFDAFHMNGDDTYIATRQEIMDYATNNGNGFKVAIDNKDPAFDKEQFSKKLGIWLKVMEAANLVYRDNGIFCLQPNAVFFRSDQTGAIRAIMNEASWLIRSMNEEFIQNVWSRHAVDSLIGTEKYTLNEDYLHKVSSVLSGNLPQLIKELNIKLKKGSVVLDLGCGTGHFLEDLAKLYNIRGVGLDFNWKAVENGNQRLKELGLKNVQLRQVDVAKQKLPANDNIVDLCMTINLHQYLSNEHIKNVTQEIFRVLKPGGTYLSVIVQDVSSGHPSKQLLTAYQSQLCKVFSAFTGWVKPRHIEELYQETGFDMKTLERLNLYNGLQTLVVVKKP